MRRNKQENDKIDNAIIQGLGEGKTISQIAIEQEISQSTVYTRIKKMKERGVEIPKGKKEKVNDAIIQGLIEGETIEQTVKKLGISQATIYYRIKKMRKRGEKIPKRKKKKVKDEEDNAILKGLREDKTIEQIAIKIGISQSQVLKRITEMRKRGVEIQKRNKKIRNDGKDNAIILGLKNGETEDLIAKKLGISAPAVSRRIKKMRERGIEIQKGNKKNENDEKDNAIIQGLREGKLKKQIASELGISSSLISRRINRMEKRGVKIQEIKKTKEYDEKDGAIIDGLKKGKTKGEIAKELGIHRATVYKRINTMRERGVEIPEKKITRQEFEKAIKNLIKSKNATKTQINELAKYYGVDIDIDEFFIEDNNQEGQGRT